jgi:hypothetical protein
MAGQNRDSSCVTERQNEQKCSVHLQAMLKAPFIDG